MNLTTGTALQNGKYILQNPLGQSALGITFRAVQAPSNQSVVLKTLRTQPQIDVAHLKRRFVEEARRFSQCQHPGLARVLNVFEDSGLPFVVMDYVAGQSLAEQVRSRSPLPELEAVQYIRQAGSALSVMHRQGLLHRDVKPENLIRPAGASFVVLVGFGLTHYAVLGVPDVAESLSPYAAIELHQRQVNLTAATDIYALAATLYFLVTGQAPITASRRPQSPIMPPRHLQPQLSAAIDHAILSGMALNPQERPQTIAAWFALLPDHQSLPVVQGLANGAGQPRAAIDLPNAAASNGSSRPTSPPTQAPPTQLPLVPVTLTPVAPAPATSAPVNVAQPTHSVAPSQRSVPAVPTPRSRLPKALMMTAAIASAFGAGLGLALRFSAAHGIGPTFFQTNQDFPPVQNWPLQASPADLSSTPALPEPVPMRSVAPEPSSRLQLPHSVPARLKPVPLPKASIAPTPTPAPSPLTPVVPPSPLPSPALPTNPAPHPVPSVQPLASPPG